jgi:hypothetical protein
MTSYCPECGESTTESDAFCSECGTPLDTEQGAADYTDQQSSGWDDQQQQGQGGYNQQSSGWNDQQQQGQEYDQQSGGWGDQQQGQEYDQQTGQRGRPPQGGTGRGGGIVRKSAVDTFSQAFSWMTGLPVLIGVFAVVAALSALAPGSPTISSVLSLVQTVVGLLVGGIAHIYTKRYVYDEQVRGSLDELSDIAGDVANKLLSLLGAAIVYGLAVGFGTLLLIIPGLYLAARLGLALPACVLDDQRAIESLKTSWSVAEGNLLKIGGLIGVLLLGFLVVGIASLVIALPITVVLGVTAGSTLASLVTAPIFGILLGAFQMALARVYLENRQPEPQRQQAGGYRQEQTQY